jgi:hypothetical protein
VLVRAFKGIYGIVGAFMAWWLGYFGGETLVWVRKVLSSLRNVQMIRGWIRLGLGLD